MIRDSFLRRFHRSKLRHFIRLVAGHHSNDLLRRTGHAFSSDTVRCGPDGVGSPFRKEHIMHPLHLLRYRGIELHDDPVRHSDEIGHEADGIGGDETAVFLNGQRFHDGHTDMSEGFSPQQSRHPVHLLLAVPDRAFVDLARQDLALDHGRPPPEDARFRQHGIHESVIGSGYHIQHQILPLQFPLRQRMDHGLGVAAGGIPSHGDGRSALHEPGRLRGRHDPVPQCGVSDPIFHTYPLGVKPSNSCSSVGL